MIELLTSCHIFSLLQGRLTLLNFAFLLKLELQLPLYLIKQIVCLEISLIASAFIEFEYIITGLLLGRY